MESNLTDFILWSLSLTSNLITILGMVYKVIKKQKIYTWLLVVNGFMVLLIDIGLATDLYGIRNHSAFIWGNLGLLTLNAGLFVYYYLYQGMNNIQVPFFDNYIENSSINLSGKFSIAFIDNDSRIRQKDRFILEDYQQRAILPDLQNIQLMENFDLIICDVIGVGIGSGMNRKANSTLKKIKELYPYKYVIAISNDENCLMEVENIVDNTMCKLNANFETKLEKAILAGIKEMAIPQNYWQKIETKLKENHIPEKRIQNYKEAYAIHLYRKRVLNR